MNAACGWPLRSTGLSKVWVDQGYKADLVAWAPLLASWVLGWWPSCRTSAVSWVLPKRWTVERIVAWLGHSRRLSKDYEGLAETHKVCGGWR